MRILSNALAHLSGNQRFPFVILMPIEVSIYIAQTTTNVIYQSVYIDVAFAFQLCECVLETGSSFFFLVFELFGRNAMQTTRNIGNKLHFSCERFFFTPNTLSLSHSLQHSQSFVLAYFTCRFEYISHLHSTREHMNIFVKIKYSKHVRRKIE